MADAFLLYFIDAIFYIIAPVCFFMLPVLCFKKKKKRTCAILFDLTLVFLSFSKMFIGGLSWQTTQGELSRTLLKEVNGSLLVFVAQ